MQNAKPVVTPAVNRNDNDDESEEASAEEHRSLRRIVGKSQFLAPRRPDIAFATKPSGEVFGMSFKIGHHCVEASPAISARYAGSRTEAASARQSVLNYDRGSPTAIGLEIDPRASPCLRGVIMLDGFLISAGAPTLSVIAQSSCEAEYIAATAATSEAKYIQALFLTCGQHVNIHLHSDSSGAIGGGQAEKVCSGYVIWTCDFCGCRRRPPKPADKRSLADQRWALQRSRNSSVMQFRNKFITIFLSLCHRS